MRNRTELMDAIHLRVPERLPYTYDARPETDALLKAHLGLGETESVADFYDCNRFTSLWAGLGKGPSMPERAARHDTGDPNVKIDMWGCRREQVESGSGAKYFELTACPLAEAESVADVEAHDWPTPEEVVWPEVPADFDLEAWKADKVVMEMGYIGPFGIVQAMFGLEAMMMTLAAEPEVMEAAIAKVEAYTLGCLEEIFRRYPGAVDLIGSGDDYGTQISLLVSPEMCRRFFMPSLKRHYDLGARHGALGYHHSCGAVFDILPDMIDAGLRVLNPVQTSAKGMEPERLKATFGRDLCFHGAIDIQQTLVTGSPDDVRAEVRHRVDTLGPEGYILCPSHTLQPDTPPENIVAMYEEVRSYGAGCTGQH